MYSRCDVIMESDLKKSLMTPLKTLTYCVTGEKAQDIRTKHKSRPGSKVKGGVTRLRDSHLIRSYQAELERERWDPTSSFSGCDTQSKPLLDFCLFCWWGCDVIERKRCLYVVIKKMFSRCVSRKVREALNAQKNAERAAMRTHFRRKYQLSKVNTHVSFHFCFKVYTTSFCHDC